MGAGVVLSVAVSAQNQSWTATDINGTTHSIADYLAEGKTVLVDVSAHWCGPCWAWHGSKIMDKLYHEFGPDGTGDLMIFFVDGDANSSMTLLQGGTGSQGDWTEGGTTPYPIIGPNGQGSTLRQIYGTQAYPTLYMHCPGSSAGVEIDREATWQEFLTSWRSACPAAFNNGAIDAHLLSSNAAEVCPGESPSTEVFNQGTGALTAATLLLKQNGNVVETLNWTGSIAPFSSQEVTFESTSLTTPQVYDMEVVVANDANPNGNIEEDVAYAIAPNAPSTLVTLELRTDNYATETTWKLFNASGAVVAQDPAGNYANNQTYTYNWTLDPTSCYRFEIYDSYGDGICCTYGQGYYRIRNTNGTPVNFVTGGEFGGLDRRSFQSATSVGISENTLDESMLVYPNPSTGLLMLDLGKAGVATAELFNGLGERVLVNNLQATGVRTMDLSGLANGIYVLNVMADGLQATRTITLNK